MSPMLAFQGNHEERSAFDTFCKSITSQLSGYFDGWFWNMVILQASHREPPIRHAILALSGLVERVQLEDRSAPSSYSDTCEGVFALQHYNRAIRELKVAAQRRELSLDVCLIACLLFATFEVSARL